MYPFSKKTEYFKPDQLKAFNEFLKQEPTPETDYKNASGDVRHVLYVKYPTGAITKETRWNGDNYITEKATVDGSRKAIVVYQVGKFGGKMESCDQDEWLAWLGKTFTATDATHVLVVDPYAAGRAGLMTQYESERKHFERDAIAEKEAELAKPPEEKKVTKSGKK